MRMTIEQAKEWVKSAISDGWTLIPEYKDSRLLKIEKQGFTAMVSTDARCFGGITVWASDQLTIKDVPAVYNWETLLQNTLKCGYCDMLGPTQRIGFAGRACPLCLVANKAKVEYPGWTD